MTAIPSEIPPLKLHTKLLYSLGSVANAVKSRGLATFLMLFYNQVVGLPPATVSGVLMLALIFDAFVDPVVGQVSDNFRSKLGRRHPFMYFAALPVAVAYFLLWNPPTGWSDESIVVWLVACLLTVRLFDTFFELPSSALAPELTRDYNERTSLVSMRAFFTVVGGLGMTVAAYQYFLAENPDGSGGILSRDGYMAYSAVSAILIFIVILASTAGTHSRIPYLVQPPTRKITLKAMTREVLHTLNNRAFVIATLTGMFIAVAAGSKNGLEIYFALYFWELTQSQLAILTTVGVAGSLCGVVVAPHIARAMGKKHGAILMFASALAVGITPIALRLVGVMPPNGTDLLFWILLTETFFNSGMAVATGVMLFSMVADVVEDAEVKTGRRSEGLLMSADNLFKKIVSGVGIFIAGAVLSMVSFPEGARRGEVSPEILQNMGLIYLPLVTLLYGLGIVCLSLFNIDKAKHEDNLRILDEAGAKATAAAHEATDTTAEPLPGGPSPIGSKA
ncbi:MFS transporter [Phenylobacterium sp.]|uniref:MFS transporter n=1 Tax=Phenylobacterium sp. TaxID=1871053 RepID=UPI002731A495|nr:MFS transporter [Phenylobacterium sp.]MDP1617503.1 MFS transporter [Phenylobacterium sp.]MDP1987013.1 MFS transporter [Phenylobacterium sp.]